MDVPDDLLDLYFREIGTVPLLTAEEERELAQAIADGRSAEAALRRDDLDPAARAELHAKVAAGHAAFERFVAANLRLVVKEAAKLARRSPLGLDELIQEGNLGLIRAVEKFDHTKGFKFSTYATWWIRQALQRGMAGKERAIRLPTGVHGNLMKVRAAQARLDAELGRPAEVGEIAAATNLEPGQVVAALDADLSVTSLDQPLSDDGDSADLGALIAVAQDTPADEVVDRLYVEDLCAVAEAQLPERAWYVLRRRYGLDGDAPQTLKHIGTELGLSREAVRKIEQHALATLRLRLASRSAA